MRKPGPVQEKSYQFAIGLIRILRQLQETDREYVLSKQCLRSGTSIGANVEEARETHYWLRLLRDSEYLESKVAAKLLNDCDELIRLLTAIVKTSQSETN